MSPPALKFKQLFNNYNNIILSYFLGNVVAIVVPVVICSIILIGLIVFCSFKYCRNENQMEQNSKQPYAMFRSSSSSADLELKVGNIHEKNISDF